VTDAYVQVGVDGAGKKIDNAALQRDPPDPARDAAVGDLVHRQRVVVGSDDNPELQAEVSGEPGKGALAVESNVLGEILGELVRIRELLQLAIGS
jgi:hypothetical protein